MKILRFCIFFSRKKSKETRLAARSPQREQERLGRSQSIGRLATTSDEKKIAEGGVRQVRLP
jgi:hypothetical protein